MSCHRDLDHFSSLQRNDFSERIRRLNFSISKLSFLVHSTAIHISVFCQDKDILWILSKSLRRRNDHFPHIFMHQKLSFMISLCMHEVYLMGDGMREEWSLLGRRIIDYILNERRFDHFTSFGGEVGSAGSNDCSMKRSTRNLAHRFSFQSRYQFSSFLVFSVSMSQLSKITFTPTPNFSQEK